MTRRSFSAELAAAANKAAERKIRGAIGRLNDKITDLVVERFASREKNRDWSFDEESRLETHVFNLRYALSELRAEGRLRLTDREEAALQAADAPLRRPGAAPKAGSSSTVTPAPPELRALPARRARGKKPAPPAAPERVINLGGQRQLLLGPARPSEES